MAHATTPPTRDQAALNERIDVNFALKAAQLGVWELDPVTNLVNWDERCRELFGLAQHNPLPYEQALRYIHPDDVDRVDQAVRWAMSAESGGGYDVTYRTIGADDGVLRWVRFSGQGYFNEAGAVYRFAGIAQDVTRDVEARQRQEMAELLQAVFDGSASGISVLHGIRDEGGAIVDFVYRLVNRVTEQTNRRRDLVGQRFSAVHPAYRQAGIFDDFVTVVETGQPLERERHYTGEGFDNWYATTVIKFDDGVVFSFRDITHDVRAREQLKASEERFRSLVEEAPVATCLFLGRELRIEVANETMLGYWGKDRSALGKPLAEALPELQGQPFLQILDDVFTTGKTYEAEAAPAELEVAGVVGTYYFDFTYKPLRNAAGDVYAVLDMAVDVTEQVMARKKLEASELYFRNLTDTAPVILWITEPDGRCSYLNRQWYAYTGQTKEEAEGFGWLDATHPADKSEAGRLFLEANEAQVSFSAIYRLRTQNGTYRWAIDKGSPRFNANGEYEGMIGTVVDVHEELTARQQLAESEAKLRSVIANAPAAIGLFVGRDLRVELPNQTFIDIVGKGPDIVGKPLREVMPELESQPFLQILDDVFTSGIMFQSFGSQVDIVQQGVMTHNFYNITYTPLFDADGAVYAILDIAIDVTDRVLAEQRLEESRMQLLASFEQSPVGIALISEDNLTFRMANPFYGQLVGRTPDELVGKPLLEALPEIRGQGFDHLLRSVIDTGTPYLANEVAVKLIRNGQLEIIYVDFTYQPYRKATAEDVSGVLVVATDVTQQVLTRQEVDANHRRFRTLLEAITTMAWTNTPSGDVDFYNQRWYDYTGLTLEQTRDWGWQAVVHPDDLPRTSTNYQQALASGNEFVVENRYRRADGEYRWHLNRALPLFDEAGQITQWVGTATDIQEQKELEGRLEQQVQARTYQLQISIQDLERSNENLQQFAYIASHDLQEPLRKIQSFGDILRKKYAAQLGEGAGHLERMQTAASRMSTLIDDLLTFSRISTQQDSSSTVSLDRVVKAVVDDLELVIEETGAIIDLESLPTVPGDRSQLSQLFQNLLNNALKFRRPGTIPRVRVSRHRVAAADLPPAVLPSRVAPAYHRIDVTDNGIGFEEQYADRIFQVFQRLHGKAEYAGTGIGLAICKKVAANHGGAITARSQPGQGATFSVYLPVSGE